jgi:hypothetical protein
MAAKPTSSILPSSFDTIPELALLLTRVKPPTPSAQPVTGTTPLPAPADGDDTLSLKQFPAATDPIKHSLQRARQHMRALPDIKRSVEEQEKEIQRLEEKREKQREQLEKLRGFGAGITFKEKDGEKKGEEREMVMR